MSEKILPPHPEVLTPNPGVLLVVTGPSGAGKDTIVKRFLGDRPGFHRIVTYASRDPRKGEVDGVHYHFVGRERFESMISMGSFAEYVDINEAKRREDPNVLPDWKGTARDDFDLVLEGKNVLWGIDPTRAATLPEFFQDNFPQEEAEKLLAASLCVYVGVQRLTTLLHRVRKRSGPEQFASIKDNFLMRLHADWDFWNANQQAFPNIVMNDGTVESATAQLERLVAKHIEHQQNRLPDSQ